MIDRYTLTPLEYGARTITEYRDNGAHERAIQRNAEAWDARDREPPPLLEDDQ